jgi:phage-related protein
MIIKYFDEFEGQWLDITGTTGTTLTYNDASGWVGVSNKVIKGNISQAGTSAPTIDEFENTTGATFTTSRTTNGVYRIDSSINLWTDNTMFITIGNNQLKNGDFVFNMQYGTATRLDLFTLLDGVLTDELLGNTSFEIKIY